MKITKQRLREIIKEELSRTLKEDEAHAMAEKQIKALIGAMQKNIEAYAEPLQDVKNGSYEDAMDSWLREIQMYAKRAKQPEIAQLASRAHANWFGTGQTLDQTRAGEDEAYRQAGRRGQS